MAPQPRYTHGAEIDEPLQLEAFDNTGVLTGRYAYHADHLASVEIIAQPFSSTGREWDEASNVYQFRARAYDPETGRFLQEDPIWFSANVVEEYRYDALGRR